MISVVVGTHKDCDLTLPDHHLSERHFEIFGVRGDVKVRDLGSLNGTRIRHYPGSSFRTVHFQTPVPITIGCAVLAGRTLIQVEWDGRVTCRTGITDQEMFRLLAGV